MESWMLILIAALVVVAVLVAVSLAMMSPQRRKSRQTATLRENFGPEYEKARGEQGRSEAEEDLMRRQSRAGLFQVRTLSAIEVNSYSERWTAAQAGFVNDPGAALAAAGELITEVISARGYSSAEFDQGAEALSVDHPRAVQHYRAAHEAARRNQRNALTTDELRAAMEDYEVVFKELIGRS
ncbi:MAG: hypothetical protein ACM3S1_00355 [Hyphomicrobiales bacterium]